MQCSTRQSLDLGVLALPLLSRGSSSKHWLGGAWRSLFVLSFCKPWKCVAVFLLDLGVCSQSSPRSAPVSLSCIH